jgi:hypothetical protein
MAWPSARRPQLAHQRERVRRPGDAAGESGAANGTVQAPHAASPSLVCVAHCRALRHAPGLFFSGSRRRSRLLADPLRRGWRARWRGLHSHPPLLAVCVPTGLDPCPVVCCLRSLPPGVKRECGGRCTALHEPRNRESEHVAQRIADILRNRPSEEVGTCDPAGTYDPTTASPRRPVIRSKRPLIDRSLDPPAPAATAES